MQELHNKLSEMLTLRFPTPEARDEAITTMGEIIINESLIEIIESIKDLDKRKAFVDAINIDDAETAERITDECGLDIYEIMTRKSEEVLADALK